MAAAVETPSRERAGVALREARRRLGMTQDRAAELLGTRQPNISRYERGQLLPGPLVRRRIEALADLPTGSSLVDSGCASMVSLAHDIRTDLRQGVPWQSTLRLIIAASDDFSALTHDAERMLFLSEPSATSDAGYDALLAGLAVHLCRLAGRHRCPSWTRGADRYLPGFWWYGAAGDSPGLRAYAWQRTPSCFRARGVVFNVDNLASV